MTRLANRVKEVAQFEQLLEIESQKRILLLKAPSSYGKSRLIGRFTQIHKEKGNGHLIRLDLSDSTAGVEHIINSLYRKLHNADFHEYKKVIKGFEVQQYFMEASDIEITGNSNTFQMSLHPDERQKQTRFNQLENAFFHGLTSIWEPTVLLIDAFEKAPEELKRWIGNEFLGVVAEQLETFRVVIAGQEVPPPRIDWGSCHHCCELSLIVEVDVWYEYAKAEQFPCNRDQIYGIVHALKGKPHDIVMALESLPKD